MGQWAKTTSKSVVDTITLQNLTRERKDNLLLYDFSKPEELEKFYLQTDQEIGGKSTAKFFHEGNRAIFEGFLNLEVPNKKMEKSGYAVFASKDLRFKQSLGIDSDFDALEMRVKTDGRIYVCNVKQESIVHGDLNQLPFSVSPGEWQQVTLPFSKFYLTWKGKIDDPQYPIVQDKIVNIGILMAQRKQGPFRFEIEWIKAVNLENRKKKKRYDALPHQRGDRVD